MYMNKQEEEDMDNALVVVVVVVGDKLLQVVVDKVADILHKGHIEEQDNLVHPIDL